MEKPNISLFVAEQFPELYREEFPQIITFMEKYYEYLETTESGRIDHLRDIDASLNRFISSLKSELAKNIPSFGNVSDADFLKVAKQFYLTRGSEDSFKFLMRAMFGISVDILYPGESILKASDGRWTQEVAIRVEISGPITDLINTSNITGNYFLLKKGSIHIVGDIHTSAEHTLGSSFLCTGVKKVTATIYDLFVDRAFTATVETGDIFNYVTKEGSHIPGVVINSVIKGTVLNGGPGASILSSAGKAAFFAGAAYIIPGIGPSAKNCIVRITSMLSTDITQISTVDIISPGNGFTTTNYIGIRPQTRVAYFISSILGDFTNTLYNPAYQIGDAYLRIDMGPLMRYRGFYTSTRGFLSDDIKIQDNNYYQNNSYVLRLDAQLTSYKNAVMSLLHPDGMALWGQFELRNNISITPLLRDAIREFLQLLTDQTKTSDIWKHDTTLVKPELTVIPDIWKHDTTLVKPELTVIPDIWSHDTTLIKPELTVIPDIWSHDTTLIKPELTSVIDDIPIFSINKAIGDVSNSSDSGQLILVVYQDYVSDIDLYFDATLSSEAYLAGSGSIVRNW